jgi:competence protein ComGC
LPQLIEFKSPINFIGKICRDAYRKGNPMNTSSNYDYSMYTQYLTKVSSLQNDDDSKKSTEDILLEGLSADSSKSANDLRPKDPLESLVEDGTITADQKQAIKDALEKSRMMFQTQMGAEKASGTFADPLEGLVDGGTITDEQAEAVKSAFETARKSEMPPPPSPPLQEDEENDTLLSILDSLVEDGTITEDQEESIRSAFASAIKAYETQSGSNAETNLSSFTADV